MPEINKPDLISDEALKVFKDLAKDIDAVTASMDRLIATTKKSEKGIIDAKSTQDTAKATKELGVAQTELEKIQIAYAKSTQKLSDEYISYKKAIQDVNKEAKARIDLGNQEAIAINAQTASYNQLGAALTKNRDLYKSLNGEAQRNSTQGKELLKVIQQQDVDYKKLSSSMGQHEKEVGSYREAIEKALGSLRKVGPEVAEVAETGISKFDTLAKFVSGPVIAAFAAVFASVTVLKKAFEEYTESTAEGAGALKQLKVEYQAFSELGREKLVELGKTTSQGLSLLANQAFAVLKPFFELIGIQEQLNVKIQQQRDLNAENKKLREDDIILTAKSGELELKAAESIFQARDKISNLDEERLAALNKNEATIRELEALERKVAEDRLAALRADFVFRGVALKDDQKALDLLHDKAALQKINKDDIKELAALESELERVEVGFFNSGRRRQALRNSITEDIIKRAVDVYHTEQEANDRTNIAIIKADQDAQSRIVGNQQKSLDEQLAALDKFQIDRAKLIDIQAEKDKRGAFDAAFGRVQVKPGENASPQAVIDAKTAAVLADKDYLATVKAIEDAANLERQRSYKEEGDKVAKIIADNYQHYIDIRKQFNKQDTNEELVELGKRYQEGIIGTTEYEKQKLAITRRAAKEDLDIQIEEQIAALALLKKTLEERGNLTQAEAELLKKISIELSEAEKQRADKDVEILQANLRKRNVFIQAFLSEMQALYQSFNQLELKQSQATIDGYEREKKALQDKADYEIELLGDNEKAKDAVRKDSEKKQKEVDKRIAEEKNKQARLQHAADVIQAGVLFTKSILAALAGGPPPFNLALAAITSAVAGVQLANVIAAPIPQYEFGTKAHKGGLAVLGDGKGAELYKEPGKHWALSPSKATVLSLARGTEVIPNEQTMQMLAMSALGGEVRIDNGNRALQQDMKSIMRENTDRTVKAIKKGNGSFVKHGSLLYRTIQDEDGNKRLIRSKNLSS